MNRLLYDFCATREDARMSASPFFYLMDINRFENGNNCFPRATGLVGGNPTTQTPYPALIDVENDLQGLVRPATKCAEYFYRPNSHGTSQGVEYIKPVRHPVVDPATFVSLPKCGVYDGVHHHHDDREDRHRSHKYSLVPPRQDY